MIKVMVDTARTEETTANRKVIKIGGTANAKNASYLVIFEHLDAKDGNIYVIIVGQTTLPVMILDVLPRQSFRKRSLLLAAV